MLIFKYQLLHIGGGKQTIRKSLDECRKDMAKYTALKTDAEDGRPISNLDISPFFNYLPGKKLDNFSTLHASGSVSQAANIIEAVCGNSKLLFIDEDKSATNFMIRDRNMRKIIKE